MIISTKHKGKLTLRQKRQEVFDRFSRLTREYGTVRICTVDVCDGGDALLLFSPPIFVPGDVPTISAHVLDPDLWRLAVEGFGSVKVAIAAFGLPEDSCQNKDCKQEV